MALELRSSTADLPPIDVGAGRLGPPSKDYGTSGGTFTGKMETHVFFTAIAFLPGTMIWWCNVAIWSLPRQASSVIYQVIACA